MNETILITGGSGYLGSMVAAHLLQIGKTVRILDNREPANKNHERLEWQSGDIRGPYDVKRAMQGVDGVIHLAAKVGEAAYKHDRSVGFETNVQGTRIVVGEAVDAAVKRLVFASTGNVYGRTDEPATEKTRVNPLCEYGESKVIGEGIVREAGYTCVRFGTACGPSVRMRWDLLPNAVVRAAIHDEEFAVFDAEAWRPFTHIRDASTALVMLATDNTPLEHICGELFNIVSENLQKGDVARYGSDVIPGWDKVKEYMAPDRRNYQMSGEFAKSWIGFRPGGSVKMAMSSAADVAMLDWFPRLVEA